MISGHDKNNISPSISESRFFGLAVGLIFLVIALWPTIWHNPARIWPLIPAIPLIVLALLLPQALRLPYKVWKIFGGALGWLNTRLILSALYILAILPIAIILKLSGKVPLKLKFDKSAPSYRESPEENSSFDPNQQY